jgi:hypothetical protein
MNTKAKQTMHPGLRGFAHLIEEMRTHLPSRKTREASRRSEAPTVSKMAARGAMKTSTLPPGV